MTTPSVHFHNVDDHKSNDAMLAKPYSKLTVLCGYPIFPVGNTFHLVSVAAHMSLSADQHQFFF